MPPSDPAAPHADMPEPVAVPPVPGLAVNEIPQHSSSWLIWGAGIAVLGLAAAGLVWILR